MSLRIVKNELLTNCSQFQGKTGLTPLLGYVILFVYQNCIGIQSFAKKICADRPAPDGLYIRWGSEQITLSFKEVFKQ